MQNYGTTCWTLFEKYHNDPLIDPLPKAEKNELQHINEMKWSYRVFNYAPKHHLLLMKASDRGRKSQF